MSKTTQPLPENDRIALCIDSEWSLGRNFKSRPADTVKNGFNELSFRKLKDSEFSLQFSLFAETQDAIYFLSQHKQILNVQA